MTHDVLSFLLTKTPSSWIEVALEQVPTLLIDHANCEMKAASTAMNLMYRYAHLYDLCQRMSRLAREELRHFEKVSRIMHQRGIQHIELSSSRYAGALRQSCRRSDPERLVDILIVSALIEARSCERFMALIPHLDQPLAAFYQSLVESEARHFHLYLEFAQQYAPESEPLAERINWFRHYESELIHTTDDLFRFQSGIPI